MKLLDLLLERYLERGARKYGKGCARVMLIAALAMKERYKDVAPTYAWIARKALNTRPSWRQINETTFVYELGPIIEQPVAENKDNQLPTGILDVTDTMSLLDVIQEVIRTELFWHHLRDQEIWKRLELIDLALNEASKYIKAN